MSSPVSQEVQSGTDEGRTKPRWRRWVVCLVLLAVIDLFPVFGPPWFRYTGADLAVHVWNLGWPMPTMIYDSRSGLHTHPLGILLIGLQVFIAIVVILRKRPTGLLVFAQLFMLWLIYTKAEMLYGLIGLWRPYPGAEPPNVLLYCNICDFAWSYWFLVVPAGIGLLVGVGLVHRHLIRTHRRGSARVLGYGTICALLIGWFVLWGLESTFRDYFDSL